MIRDVRQKLGSVFECRLANKMYEVLVGCSPGLIFKAPPRCFWEGEMPFRGGGVTIQRSRPIVDLAPTLTSNLAKILN